MIDTTKRLAAEYVENGMELDLDGDEYGDNENAPYGFAVVLDYSSWYSEGEPWVTLFTDQGSFDVPAGHKLKVKVND